MEVLRTFFLPGLFHRCTFGVAHKRHLLAMDVAIRNSVRRWLRLPHDVPRALFHAPVRFGGLGIPCFRVLVPFLRARRFAGVDDVLENFGLNDIVRDELGSDFQGGGEVPPHPCGKMINDLYLSVDGSDLDGVGEVSASSSWLVRRSCDISGRDYVQYLRLYAGALPAMSRLSRGRAPPGGAVCRHGCGVPETNAHAVNYCRTVKPGVILRHHAVVKLLGESLRIAGWRVMVERTLVVDGVTCRPDLVAVRDAELVILDVTVVTGPIAKETLSQLKVAKYGREPVFRKASEAAGATPSRCRVVPVTITYKGVWSKYSAQELKKMGVLARALGWMTLRILRGGHMNFNTFRNRPATNRLLPAPRRHPP